MSTLTMVANERVRTRAPEPGECHIWTVPVLADPPCPVHLNAEETKRADFLTVPAIRNVFVTSRSAQRLIGAHYLGTSPADVAIVRDCGYCGNRRHGRPRFLESGLDYSVSHTDHWVLIAVVADGIVGVDVEEFSDKRDTELLSQLVLTPAEKERFARLEPADRRARFFAAWTRKEAAMKLTGLGLRTAPNQLDVGGPLLVPGKVPAWEATPVYLYDLPAPAGHVAGLASTVPVLRLRGRRLEGEPL